MTLVVANQITLLNLMTTGTHAVKLRVNLAVVVKTVGSPQATHHAGSHFVLFVHGAHCSFVKITSYVSSKETNFINNSCKLLLLTDLKLI
jgi:hypothetical protein